MKNRQAVCTFMMQKTAILVLAVTLMLTLVTVARAEPLTRYHPQSLIDAEIALEQGRPEQALAHLHRARAVLRHGDFRFQRDALACEAYLQLQALEPAARVCREMVAYDGDGSLPKAHDPVRD